MISPGYPAEMPFFVRGLAYSGVRVVGLGDQPVDALPELARAHLHDYWRVASFADEAAIVAQVAHTPAARGIDAVESLWEPTMVLAARLREVLALPGMSVEQTLPFRDKERMKRVLDASGIRTPHHYSARTAAGVREAAATIGYPIVVKPIAGAGSASTFRIDGDADLEGVLPALRRVPEVSVEEFVDAEEFTYDTICAGGEPLYENVCWYRPRPLVSRQLEWISPITTVLRDISVPHLESGVRMGRAVLRALGFQSGFTHMEWYRRWDGEAVFGEIGARPPGARTVDVMNFATDTDLFQRWAEAVTRGGFSTQVTRTYNAASVFKRAQGRGRIVRIDGLSHLLAEYDEHVCVVDLLPLGAPRRDWLQTLISDGMVIVRHQLLERCNEIADRFASELQLHAAWRPDAPP
jgi:biotin carboxylase